MNQNVNNDDCIAAYRKHKNLKVAAYEVGIPWQTLYVRLVKAGEPVVGDKARYGSMSDKLGAKGERLFQELVPLAENNNDREFQAKCDFTVRGLSVDVKAAPPKQTNKKYKGRSWAFSISRQESVADFFVCFGFSDNREDVDSVFLLPGEIVRFMRTISISVAGDSKWKDYIIEKEELLEFFDSL